MKIKTKLQNGFVLVSNIEKLKGLSPLAQIVYFWLCYHSDNKTGQCYPSLELLSKEANISKNSVIRSIKILENQELIKTSKIKGKVNFYTITAKAGIQATKSTKLENLTSATGELVRDLTSATGEPVPVPQVNPNYTNRTNIKNNIKKNTKNTENIISYFNLINAKNYRLTPSREKKIKDRLKTYTVEEIKKAIDGLKTSPFHNGQNDRNWSADIDFIIRNDEQIDKFINKVPINPIHETSSDPENYTPDPL